MSPMATLLSAPIRAYRLLLSPWLGTQCRFTPTCSAYALQALEHHGAWRGAALAGWRVMRCHPWCQGGHDPVAGAPMAGLQATADTAPRASGAVNATAPNLQISPSPNARPKGAQP